MSGVKSDDKLSTSKSFSRIWSIALVLVLGIGISLFFFNFVKKREITFNKNLFQQDVYDRIYALEERLDKNIQVLLATRSLFNASANVNRQEFRQFVTPYLTSQYAIRAITWVPKVVLQDRERFETRGRAWKPDYRIREIGDSKELVPAKERSEYYPVYYSEQIPGNAGVPGFDLASNPTRREALFKARDAGIPIATSPIRLIDEKTDNYGFLIFVPVYKVNSVLHSTALRRSNLAGFIVGVFNIHSIVEAALSTFPDAGVDFFVCDLEDNGIERLVDYHASNTNIAPPGVEDECPSRTGDWTTASEIHFAERLWVLAGRPASDRPRFQKEFHPWIILAFGLLITFLLTTVIAQIQGRTNRIRQLADKRAEELVDSKQRLDIVLQNAGVGLWDRNEETGEIKHDERWAAMLGYDPKERRHYIGDWEEMIHPSDRQGILSEFQQILDGNSDTFSARYRIKLKDGNWKWILDKGRVVEHDIAGAPLHTAGINIDIDHIKKAEIELEKSEKTLRAIVDTAVEGIITINKKGIIQSANPSAQEMFQYERDELIGQNVSILMPEPYHGEHDQYIAEYLKTGNKKIIGISRGVKGRKKRRHTFRYLSIGGRISAWGRFNVRGYYPRYFGTKKD